MIAEWIVSVMTLIMSIAFFVTTFSFPCLPADPAGLALFPRILCIIAAVFASILIGQLVARTRAGKGSTLDFLRALGRDAWRREACGEKDAQMRRMTLVIVFSVCYPWLIIRAGFMAATAVYAFILMRLFKTRVLPSILLSIFVAVALYLFFAQLLQAYVPTGTWLEPLMDY